MKLEKINFAILDIKKKYVRLYIYVCFILENSELKQTTNVTSGGLDVFKSSPIIFHAKRLVCNQ